MYLCLTLLVIVGSIVLGNADVLNDMETMLAPNINSEDFSYEYVNFVETIPIV